MATAKVSSLKVRPTQSVDLCFEVDGILGEQVMANAKLGASVSAFNLDALYTALGQNNSVVAARPGLLKYDSQAIHDAAKSMAFGGTLLFALRAESVKALLDQA